MHSERLFQEKEMDTISLMVLVAKEFSNVASNKEAHQSGFFLEFALSSLYKYILNLREARYDKFPSISNINALQEYILKTTLSLLFYWD